MYLIGNLIYDMIKDSGAKSHRRATLGADPVAYAVSYTSYLKGKPVETFVRKSAKAHGTMLWIEGNVKEGDRVVIVDDVLPQATNHRGNYKGKRGRA